MAKKYILVGALTYMSAKATFKAGEHYSEDQVADHVDDLRDDGEPFFAEVEVGDDGEVTKGKKTLKIGKTTKAPDADKVPAPDAGTGDKPITV